MEHLVTLHHVKMWLEYNRQKVPESEADLIEKCKKIHRIRKVDHKVIDSDDLHFKCKKARIRFTKEKADELYTRQIFEDNSSVLNQNQSKPVEIKTMKKDLKKLKEKLKVHRNKKLKKPKKKSSGIENTMDVGDVSEDAAQPTSLFPTVANSTVSVREPSETSNITEDVHNEAVSDIRAVDILGNEVSTPECSPVNTVALTDDEPVNVNSENPMNSIKAEVVDEMKDEELKAEIESFTTKAKVRSIVEGEMIDLTQKSKLSLSEYKNIQQEKEKKRETEAARLEAEREATEIVVLGQRRTVAPTSRQSRLSDKEVKKEEPLDEVMDQVTVAASELLPVPEENTGSQVTDTPDLNPEIVFKKKVKAAVNDLLLNYYDNGSDSSNKTIKIPNSEQFIKLCMDFSRQIREEIKETYHSINGSLDGIEKINVMEFGIDNIIQKYFENLPVLD